MLSTFAVMNERRILRGVRPRPGPRGGPSMATASSGAAPLADPDEYEDDEDECLCTGHAVDVLQLWQRSWFGWAPKGKGGSRAARPRSSPGGSPRLKPALDDSAPSTGTARTARASPFASSGALAAAAAQEQQPAQQPQQPPPSRQPSAPVPASLPKLPPEALAVQELPGIGTWAGRQRLFARPADLRGIPRTPSSGTPQQLGSPLGTPGEGAGGLEAAADGERGSGEAAPAAAARGGGLPPLPRTPDDGGAALASARSSVRSEERAREAAWRWRFTRKWEAEQKKYYEEAGPGNGSVVSNDELDAIRYTQACGMGEALQFAGPPLHRSNSRQSEGGGSGLHHSTSCQFDVSGHGGSFALGALSLAAENSQDGTQHAGGGGGGGVPRPKSGGGGAKGVAPWLSPASEQQQPSATKVVLSMATKARDLLQKQQQIEAEAQSRWERSLTGGSDEPWAGQHLRPVQIGMSGRFRFVVLRAVDSKGRQRYLVRGRSRATPAELSDEASQEAAAACKRHGLPPLTVEPVGGGVMEWREDTDRHLHVSAAPSSGDSLSGGGGGQPNPAYSPAFSPAKSPALVDVTGLACSLVRQVLPCHFQITTTSAPSRMASLMDTLHI